MRSLPLILHPCATLIALCLLTVSAIAGERTTTKPAPFQSDRYDIVDGCGNRVGSIKKDALDSRRLKIYTGNGELTHIVKPSTPPPSTSRYDVYNRSGDTAGTIKKDPLRDDRYGFSGKTIRRNVLRPDRWVIEK